MKYMALELSDRCKMCTTDPLWGESIGERRITLKRAINMEDITCHGVFMYLNHAEELSARSPVAYPHFL